MDTITLHTISLQKKGFSMDPITAPKCLQKSVISAKNVLNIVVTNKFENILGRNCLPNTSGTLKSRKITIEYIKDRRSSNCFFLAFRCPSGHIFNTLSWHLARKSQSSQKKCIDILDALRSFLRPGKDPAGGPLQESSRSPATFRQIVAMSVPVCEWIAC